MKIKFKIGDLSEILFIISFIIFLSLTFLSSTLLYQYIPETIVKLGYIFTILIAVIRELLWGKYSARVIIILFFICILTAIVMFATNLLNSVAISILFIFFFRDIPFSKIAKLAMITSIVLLIVVIFSSKIGIIQNYLEITRDGRIRNYLGFRYSLFAPNILFNIFAIWCFLNRNCFRPLITSLLLVINFWMFKQTDSRLAFYTTILLIIFYFLYSLFQSISTKIKSLLIPFIIIYPFSALLSYFVTISYRDPSDFFVRLNSLLGGRIYLAYYSLQKFGFGLFGQDIVWQGNGLDIRGNYTTISYLYVDNLYIQLLQRFGLIFVFIFLIATVLLLFKLIKKNEIFLAGIIIMLALHAFIDDLILYPQFNIFWFLFAIIFNNKYLIDVHNLEE